MTTQEKIPSYRLLGSSGLRVYPLSLGTMGFGIGSGFFGENGLASNFEESEKIFLKYLSVGGNFIDTANFYQKGESEEWIGKIIKKNNIDRERLIIATKYSLPMVSGDPNAAGNNKKNMFRAVRDSLARLQMDYIDILYVHFWDWSVNIKDLMRELHEIVLSGKVLHIAASDIPAWVVATGNTIAEQHGWSKFVCYQGKYNLIERDMEFEIFPMCKANQIATVPWGAVAQGKLTGVKTRENPTNGKRGRVVMTENDFKIQDVVIEIAKEIGKSPSQVALAWAIQKSTSPLLGCRTYEQLEDSLQAIDIALTTEQFNRLEEVSSPKPIFPYTMLGKDTKSTGVLWAPNPMQKTYDFDTKQ